MVSKAVKDVNVICLKGFDEQFNFEKGSVLLYCDSQSVIYLTNNQVFHGKIRHRCEALMIK